MIELLSFDSKLFGYKIGSAVSEDLITSGDLEILIADARKAQYDCLYAQIDPEKVQLISYLSQHNITPIEEKIVLVTETKNHSYDETSDEETFPTGIGGIKKMADCISQVSRFYKDRKFHDKAAKLYEIWIKKSLYAGYSRKYFIKKKGRSLSGLITLKERKQALHIDLLGVLPEDRKKGIGEELLETALGWCNQNRIKSLQVTTQSDNIDAMSVYKEHGFKTLNTAYYYHIWINH